MQEFEPRGWRAALAAERQGVARLRATAQQSAETLSRHAGRVTARLLTPQPAHPSEPRLAERELPWGPVPEPQAECPSPAVAVPSRTAWHMGQGHWLLVVAAVAVMGFIAGWLSGRWHLRQQRYRRKALMQQPSVPARTAAATAAAAAQAQPDTTFLVTAAEQAQQHAAGLSADAVAPSAAGHQSWEHAESKQSVELQPAVAMSAKAPAAEGNTSHADDAAYSVATSAAQTEAPLKSSMAAARPATVQPSADDVSSQPAAAQATAGPSEGQTQLAEDEAGGIPARQQGQRVLAPASGTNTQQQLPAVQEAAVATAQPAVAASTTEASPEVSSAAAEQQPPQPTVSHPAEAEESWNNAAQLVAVVAQQLGIRVDDLSPGEKIQLITAAIGAWQTFQQRVHHRDASAQGDTANAMRWQHNRLVAAGITDKRARFQSQQALRGVARLQQSLADCTVLGLALQALAALYCGARYGLLHTRLAACPAASPGGVSLLRPWEVLAPLQAAACWVFTIGDVLLGVLIVLGTCFVLLRTRLLASYHVMPLNKLLLGLGCACGCLGYFAIGKLGGSPQMWLALWWTWIGGQCALVMNLDAVRALLQPPEQAPGGAAAALDAKHGHTLHGPEGALLPGPEAESGGRRLLRSAAKPAFVVGAAIWLPLTMGCAPFERSAASELLKLLFR